MNFSLGVPLFAFEIVAGIVEFGRSPLGTNLFPDGKSD